MINALTNMLPNFFISLYCINFVTMLSYFIFLAQFHEDTLLRIRSVIHLHTIQNVKTDGNGGDARKKGEYFY